MPFLKFERFRFYDDSAVHVTTVTATGVHRLNAVTMPVAFSAVNSMQSRGRDLRMRHRQGLHSPLCARDLRARNAGKRDP